MSAESDFIAALRGIADHPAARGLADDAAVIEIGGVNLVLTHDMIIEGVHYLPGDPPQEVAWKLVAVNLSDLAAKGAVPAGVLLGYSLGDDSEWNRAFVAGLSAALAHFEVPLLGGDTVSAPPGNARSLGLTAIGTTSAAVPSRAGARAGDALYITRPVGDSWAGLQLLRAGRTGPQALIAAYRRPEPQLAAGQALSPLVNAMMDVSDGLLIDAARMAEASGLALAIELGDVPLSDAFVAEHGDSQAARLDAATGGDDYCLLLACAPDVELPLPAWRVGSLAAGKGVALTFAGQAIPLPARLGFEHC